jgi:hypothetical protein
VKLRAIGLAFREAGIARLQLQVKPAPGACAVVIGEFQLHIQPLVLRGRNLEALLIGAGDARSHLQRQQLPASPNGAKQMPPPTIAV